MDPIVAIFVSDTSDDEVEVELRRGTLSCMRVGTYIIVCMYVCTYVCMYVCTYVCMYVCMQTALVYLPFLIRHHNDFPLVDVFDPKQVTSDHNCPKQRRSSPKTRCSARQSLSSRQLYIQPCPPRINPKRPATITHSPTQRGRSLCPLIGHGRRSPLASAAPLKTQSSRELISHIELIACHAFES